MIRLHRACRVLALLALAAAPAGAATLSAVDILDPRIVVQDDGQGTPETQALFSSEVKRDQQVQNNGQSGHDLFLRDSTGRTVRSSNFGWGASGTTYAWTYVYDGTTAGLTVGNSSIAGNAPGGTPGNSQGAGAGQATGSSWNVLSFFLRADDTTRFSSSTVTVSVTAANGTALSTPLTLSVTNGQQTSPWYALDSFSAISSLSGTLRFDFALLAGARNSPNSRLAFSLSAQHVTPVSGVPLPGAGLSLLGALVGLAAVRRRIVLAVG
jgi:hypothetical protein